MSEKRTSWILKLVDKVSDPIKKIITNSDKATQAAQKLSQQYEKLSAKADEFGGALKKLAVGGAAFVALTYGSMQFETGMAKANTMANLGAKEFALLNEQVMAIAENVPLARTELADGLYETISNGVPEQNWISFLNDSSKAAIGGLSDIKEVVGVTSTIIKNYQMDWEKAGSIHDKIQNTAKLGKTSFQELGNALPKVTGNAATLGIGIDELLGTFGTLTGVSGNTAEVSTQLSAIFTSLIKPTAEATEVAKNMGIQFDSLSIKKAGGVIEFFDKLKSKVEQYSKQTGRNSTEIYGKLLGSAESLRAFIPLTSSVAEDFKNKTKEIANSAGVMDSAFNIMATTTDSQFQLIRNRFGNAVDSILKSFRPYIAILLKGATSFLKFSKGFIDAHPVIFGIVAAIAAASFGALVFGNLLGYVIVRSRMSIVEFKRMKVLVSDYAKNMQKAGIAALNFAKKQAIAGWEIMKTGAKALWAGVVGLPALVAGLWSWVAGQTALNVVLNANPVGAVILGVAALIGIIVLVVKYWDNIKQYLIEFGKFFMKYSPFGFLFRLLDMIPGFKESLYSVLDGFMFWVKRMWDKVSAIFGSIADFLGLSFDTKIHAEVEYSEGESPNGNIDHFPTPLLDNSSSFAGGSGATPSGANSEASTASSGGLKSITQNITVQQYFTLPENWKDEFENIRRSTASLISASAADGAAVLG